MSINPNPGILQYPRIRKSPFFYASRRHGVGMYSVYNHTYHARHYGDPVAEYWALLEDVTLWDVGVERQVEITGPDAFEFTNMLVPRDLNKCKIGQCKYVFITAEDGGIINDPVLLRLGENHFWLSLADSDVLLWAKGLAYSLGMNVQIREPDVGPVQVQGPKSRDVMVDLFGESILDVPYYYAVDRELDGMQMVVSRTGFTAELGYEIYLHNASRDGVKLWETIWEAGRPYNMRVIGPCHIRRIEGGLLSWGNDITYNTNPFEVGYGFEATWMVDLNQEADFIGKQALTRVANEGIARKLVGVEIGGPSVGSFNDGSMIDVFDVRDPHGLRIGEVTSACYSPRLERNIGYAMVPISYYETGTPLVVDTQHGPQDAVVVEKPFLDAKKDIPKQLQRQETAVPSR
ncbi:aminomethyltransferase [Halopolyspora algeriensis]|uniref:Aminomethyltransferase n=1 Tax=Halopolyspora algeriensis TaxID=1500506 RepID=A0A368VN39_9ACTN|nr:glycine cleavage T C-terminal barrel domain-containing protein [Halopolyspora algeriensis]RCW43139.1 aminomethyltransferase [Halopolyspora algeriensis]TQM56197.1 aminomethyltransferase [Halopolyspora algeriensis]